MKPARLLIALAAATALACPGALAKPKAKPAPDAGAASPTSPTGAADAPSAPKPPADAAASIPLNTLKPGQLPANVAVVGQDEAPLGSVTKILVDSTGNISSIIVTPTGAAQGRKVPAVQVALANDRLVVAMDKAAFKALPAAS
jgi:hypothetical protein